MKNIIPFMKPILWLCFGWFFVCGSMPPREGVITEIIKHEPKSLALYAQKDIYSDPHRIESYIFMKDINGNLITQTLDEVKIFVTDNGSVIIGGGYDLYFAGYGCYKNTSQQNGYYVRILKRDEVLINENIVFIDTFIMPADAPTGIWGKNNSKIAYYIKVTFDDPTLSTPETHEYRLEFWECLGECKPDEYDKKTDKKGEIVINYSVVP